ncbi:MAG TPA: hypothetical protein VFF49_11315 [Thermodesulfobacteriota bacterium]|nr:hypothetical protein [Thermodesulfobacteriota bacterium]
MPNGKVTISDVYEIVNRVEDKLDKVVERVSSLELWRANIMGKLVAFVAFINVIGIFAIDWIKSKIK